MKKEPYFLSNKEWYYFDELEFCYKLTDKAPKEAVKSYNEFYKDKLHENNNGEMWITC